MCKSVFVRLVSLHKKCQRCNASESYVTPPTLHQNMCPNPCPEVSPTTRAEMLCQNFRGSVPKCWWVCAQICAQICVGLCPICLMEKPSKIIDFQSREVPKKSPSGRPRWAPGGVRGSDLGNWNRAVWAQQGGIWAHLTFKYYTDPSLP
jgi:hypothetical protein